MKRCQRRHGPVAGFAAFGLGLLAYAVLPAKLLVILIGIALILCGCSCGKR